MQKKRKSSSLASEMVKLANEGVEGIDIAERLGLSLAQAKNIHYQLLMDGKLSHSIKLNFNSPKAIKVNKTGLAIPFGRLERLGLASLFKAGTPIKCRAGEKCLIIEAASNKDSKNGDSFSLQSEDLSTKPVQLALPEARLCVHGGGN